MSGLQTISSTYSGVYYGQAPAQFNDWCNAVSRREHEDMAAKITFVLYGDQSETQWHGKVLEESRQRDEEEEVEVVALLEEEEAMEMDEEQEEVEEVRAQLTVKAPSKLEDIAEAKYEGDEESDSEDDDDDDEYVNDEANEADEPVKLGKRPSVERRSPSKRTRLSNGDIGDDSIWTPEKPAQHRPAPTPNPNPKRRTKIAIPSTPIKSPDARLAIILASIGTPQRKRAHLRPFYASLQPGPQQLQQLGELDHHLSRAERIAYMRADEWIAPSTLARWEATCAGCGKVIKLEGPRKDREAKVRNPKALKKDAVEYYPGNWNKHRNQCRGVYKVWCERNGLVPDEGRSSVRTKSKPKGRGAKGNALAAPAAVSEDEDGEAGAKREERETRPVPARFNRKADLARPPARPLTRRGSSVNI